MTITEQLAEALQATMAYCPSRDVFQAAKDALAAYEASKAQGRIARPATVEELEKLLNSEDETPIEILPDGSVKALPAQGQDIDGLADELWRDLVEKDDRTSPEEYPDMALIKRDEFRAALLALQQKLRGGE